jgi:hypothetical protein
MSTSNNSSSSVEQDIRSQNDTVNGTGSASGETTEQQKPLMIDTVLDKNETSENEAYLELLSRTSENN